MNEQNSPSKNYSERLKKNISQFFNLLTRPFIDFYYNYGLTRASVLSYILCVNLVVYVYLVLSIGGTVGIEVLERAEPAKRFLEWHFLWPVKPDKKSFSITNEFAKSLIEAIKTFKKERKLLPSKEGSDDLGAGFFVILAIACVALLLNLKTNLAESVSPLIWGNLPISRRGSQISKILWRIPSWNVIKARLSLFIMLPMLVALAIIVLSAINNIIDKFLDPYSTSNTVLTVFISLVITTLLFATLYKINVGEISNKSAVIGAFVAATLWLGGRWYFTSFAARSLYSNLLNFAFIPLFLTWFYYFCAVFLLGLNIAQTLDNPNLSSTGRSWIMRDITAINRYTTTSMWVRLDFLYRLAQNRYEEYPPPFIGINVRGDDADEIANQSNSPPSFVRECILEMISNNPSVFYVEAEGNRQYCKLKHPPEEVNIMPLIVDTQEIKGMLEGMEEYHFGHFIMDHFGPYWSKEAIYLSSIYNDYRTYHKKTRSDFYAFMDETEERPVFTLPPETQGPVD